MTPVEATAAPAVLDAHRTACASPDAPIDAYLAFLRELATADLDTLAPGETDSLRKRSVALGRMQGTVEALTILLTRQLSPELRSAPASVLNELIDDSLVFCRNEACFVKVAPWGDVTCGDPACDSAVVRLFGADAS